MRKKNKLTVVIPFLNEGVEIERTVKSIRETAKDEVDILLINDNSEDDFNYEDVAKKNRAMYVENKIRLGVAGSRDVGAKLVETEYLIFIDGHMRFYHNNWWNEINYNLDKSKKTLFCCCCRAIDSDGNRTSNDVGFGARLHINGNKWNHIVEPYWDLIDRYKDERIIDIPCVLGASYAISKDYWLYLKGLSGLLSYGGDEAYISLKVWRSGGSCKLIKNIDVGHIFRVQAPYHIQWEDSIFNKLLIAETIFPESLKLEIEDSLKRIYPYYYYLAKQMLNKERKKIIALKKYYKSIFTVDMCEFIHMNN